MRSVLVGLSVSLIGCANGMVDRDTGRPLMPVDTGIGVPDTGPLVPDAGRDARIGSEDAFVEDDAFEEIDAFTPIDAFNPIDAHRVADAFTPSDAFVGRDAFVPVDAGRDAYTAPDAFSAPDAYAPSGCTPPPAGGSLVLSGTTVGAPSAPRPDPGLFADCPSDLTTSVPFSTHTICANSVAATYEIRVGGSIPDSYLVLYEGLSVPADRTDCALLDDDSAGASQAMITVDVAAGTPFTAMVTGYRASDVGAYTLTIRRL